MKAYLKAWLTVLALALGALVIITLVSQPTRAAGPWYVAPGGNDGNSCLDPGAACATINGALNKPGFVAGDTIRVATGTHTGTGSEVVLLNKNAALSGGWNSTFTTQSGTSTIDGQGARRGITVNSGVTAVVECFAVQNGLDSIVPFSGGGIQNSGILTLTNSTISSNTVGEIGYGGWGGGGGIYNSGTLALNNSTVSGNTILGSFNGGGIYNDFGTLTMNNSLVSGNTATNSGGGIRNYFGTVTLNNSIVSGNMVPGTCEYCGSGGGIQHDNGILILNNSTVSDNTAHYTGGGIHNDYDGTLTLNNSTISGNMARHGGGILRWSGTTTLNNSTVSGNTATWTFGGYGGGIYNGGYDTLTLQNTIVAGNTGSIGPDCSGSNISSSGYNLIGDTSGCTFTPIVGDLTNVDAKLDPLRNNGGPTLTHALLPSSPAINAGNPAGCMGSTGLLTTDQRGFPRFGRCDIGAYKMQPIGFSTKTVNPSTALPGDPLTYTIALNNGGATDITNVRVTDTLPIFLTYINGSLTATSGSYGYNNGVITWTGSVNAGEVVTITFGAIISDNVPLGTVITNTAIISGAGSIFERSAATTVEGGAPEVSTIYFPIILKNYTPGIYGRVTENGAGAAGVPLSLRFYNGSSWSTRASTTTASDGTYRFTGVPSLGSGQYYYVRYLNTGGTPGRLWRWDTRYLASYSAGSDVHIGDFDIADIPLVSPADGATVALPYTFQWTRRTATPSDDYEWNLYDSADQDPWWWTDPTLGYVGSYTLNSLPSGFSTGTQYAWEIWVYSPDGGRGISYESRLVMFSNTGLGLGETASTSEPSRLLEDFIRKRSR